MIRRTTRNRVGGPDDRARHGPAEACLTTATDRAAETRDRPATEDLA